MSRVPRNETGQADNLMFLAEAMMRGGADGLVEEQEKRGQTSFVNSDTLPTDVYPADKAKLEEWGVVFGDVVEGDPIFTHATLPEGWKKVPTDHDMWSDLVDADGIVRASIFYKAAFYDRSAQISAKKDVP